MFLLLMLTCKRLSGDTPVTPTGPVVLQFANGEVLQFSDGTLLAF